MLTTNEGFPLVKTARHVKSESFFDVLACFHIIRKFCCFVYFRGLGRAFPATIRFWGILERDAFEDGFVFFFFFYFDERSIYFLGFVCLT